MADLQPVRPPRASLDGHGALAATIVVILILAAMIKPWGGSGGPPPATLFPTAPSSERPSGEQPAPRATSPSGFDLRYRPELFGGPEPLPGWGLWPAGYLVTFGFAAPVPPVASAQPSASVGPGRSAGPSTSSADPIGTALQWPVRFDVSEGSHLLVLGINTPLGYDVSRVDLRRYTSGRRARPGWDRTAPIAVAGSLHGGRHPQPGDRWSSRGLADWPVPARLDHRSGRDRAVDRDPDPAAAGRRTEP